MGLKICLFLVYVLIILKAFGVLAGLLFIAFTPIIFPLAIQFLICYTVFSCP
jgi:hypothetical protein